MKRLKAVSTSLWSLFLVGVGLAGCAAQKFQPTLAATTAAISRGEAKEFIGAMESGAVEAERNRGWALAAGFYNEASLAARNIGQLQRALSYSSRALELAEKARDQEKLVRAVVNLALVHTTLRQYEKAKVYTQKGVEVTRTLPPGLLKQAFDGLFNRLLGEEYLRIGDLRNAIDYLSYSVQVQESRLAFHVSKRAYLDAGILENSVQFVVFSLNLLADCPVFFQ